MYQALGQEGFAALYTVASTTAPAARVPMVAPKPLVIIMNRPWALERMSSAAFCSTYREPEMLKKSNAMPYTMQLSTNRRTPGMAGLPIPKKAKRSTQANMEMSITFLMPNFFMKNGMRRMHRVSEAWEMAIRALEFFTAKVSARAGSAAKEPRKVFA